MRVKNKSTVRTSKYAEFILGGILMLWLCIALSRTIYNDSKIFTQDRHLFGLTRWEVDREIYGPIESMRQQIAKVTKGRPFLIVSDDGGIYFYLRYLLFPQKVYWANNIFFAEEQTKPWEYVYYPDGKVKKDGKKTIILHDEVTGRSLGTIIKI